MIASTCCGARKTAGEQTITQRRPLDQRGSSWTMPTTAPLTGVVLPTSS
jgi:hypothetical protein